MTRTKRQKEVLKFIEGMMTPIVVKQSIVDSFMQDGTLEESLDISDQSENSKIIVSRVDKYRVKWMEPLTAPKVRDMKEDPLPFIKDRRRRDLEGLFNKQGSAKWRVWSLELNSAIDAPTNLSSQPYMVKRPFEKEWLSEEPEVCEMSDFEVKEEGFVAMMDKDLKGRCLPVLVFERLA